MKAKKTIRKLPKISRKLAHFQRELYNMQKRLTTMISEVTEAEKKLAVYELLDAEAESACRTESDPTIENEHESGPPGGDIGRQIELPDCRSADIVLGHARIDAKLERDRWLP
jgi:hypothetical protein